MSTLEQRMEKMEKTIRNYRIAFVAVFLPAIVLIFSFAHKDPVSDIVKAKTFQVVDDYGAVLATLTSKSNAGQLIISDSRGNKLINMLRSDGGTGAIAVFDDKGR